MGPTLGVPERRSRRIVTKTVTFSIRLQHKIRKERNVQLGPIVMMRLSPKSEAVDVEYHVMDLAPQPRSFNHCCPRLVSSREGAVLIGSHFSSQDIQPTAQVSRPVQVNPGLGSSTAAPA